MLYFVFIGMISVAIILMARIKIFDIKSEKNRERVRKCRQKKRLRLIYENLVQRKMAANKTNHDVENPKFENVHVHDESTIDGEQMFVHQLRNWSINNRITAMAMTELLGILRSVGFTYLPKDSRTIMGTPKNIKIDDLTNGKMWFNGIGKCLEKIHLNEKFDCALTLDWNFDGLPVFRSSNLQFWPMLASIQGIEMIFLLNFTNKFETNYL